MNSSRARNRTRRAPGRRWYLAVVTALLLVAAFFRLWDLRGAPPGMSTDELINAQLADHMREGDVSVVYSRVAPAREGLYFAILAASTSLTGRGTIFWRLPSALISLLSLAVTASLARRLFGVRVALLTLGLMAVLFWPVWLGRAVNHLTLMPLLTALTIYVLSRTFMARPTQTGLWFTASGLLIGIAQYAHATAWTLLLLPVVFILVRWMVNPDEVRRHWGNIFYALGLIFVLIIPLLLYLLIHPGSRGGVDLGPWPDALLEIPRRFVETLGGLVIRGDTFPNANLPGHPLLGPVIGLLAIVGLGIAIARWRRPTYTLALVWLVIGLLPPLTVARSPNFEYMVILLPLLLMLPGIALRELYVAARVGLARWDQIRYFLVGINILVGALIAGNAILTARDYFGQWVSLPEVRQAYQAEVGALAGYLDSDTDPTPVVICSPPVDRTEYPFALTNDQLLGYLMHRRDLPLRYFDCTQSLLFVNGGEAQRMIFPRGHYYDLLPGPLLAWMAYAHNETVPGIGPDVVMRIDVSHPLADRAGAFITTAPTAWAPETGQFRLAQLPVSFGHNVTFLGYDLRDDVLQPSDYVELVTYWRLDGPPPPELTMFAHLLGSPVVVLAQNDQLGVNVGQLQTRDVFIEYSLLQTPQGITPGLYPLSVGLYLPSSGQRLQAFEGDQARGDRLFLQRITIKP